MKCGVIGFCRRRMDDMRRRNLVTAREKANKSASDLQSNGKFDVKNGKDKTYTSGEKLALAIQNVLQFP